jgi:tetratricopeptide (TPR) repeat protein/tRNA A-37 threonylcarbamoyl transferase component Bud32
MASVIKSLIIALEHRYVIERELGHGAMAMVYLAEDRKHHRRVAVKVLRPELAAALGPERFLREIEILAGLQHPHILPLHDSGEADGWLYYVTPYVDGESLRGRLEREHQLQIHDAVRIAREVADALNYAHAHGVVHRDVKPENILLGSGHAIVADFGIARAINAAGGDTLTATGIALGTPAYLSPEQATGSDDVDGRSDIYALGCVLYEMLAGAPPFVGRTAERIMQQHLTAEPPPVTTVRPAVPAQLAQVVQRALAKAPADRYATGSDVVLALESGRQSLSSRPRSGRLAVVVAAIGVLAIAAFAWRPVSALLEHRSAAAAVPRREWVLIADFDGPDDDPTLPLAVRELVGAVIDQSNLFASVPRDHFGEARRLAQLPDTARLTAERARHLAYRSAVRVVVEGRVDRVVRGNYGLVLRALNVKDGTPVASASGAATDETIMRVVERLARELRGQLGERRGALDAAPPVAAVITPSFEAYRKFIEANERGRRGNFAERRALLREALALDPDFAAAWLALGTNYLSELGLRDSALPALAEARRRPERLTPRDRIVLEIELAPDSVDILLFEELLRSRPGDPSAYNGRAMTLMSLGRYDEGLEDFRRAVEPSPLGPPQIYLGNYGAYLAYNGRLPEAREIARRLTGPIRRRIDIGIALAAEDWAAAERLGAELEHDAVQPAAHRLRGTLAVASAEAARGRVSAARAALRRAQTEARVQGLVTAQPWLAELVLAVAAGGLAGRAPPDLGSDTANALAPLLRGTWAALAGDTSNARRQQRAVRERVAKPAPLSRDPSFAPTQLEGAIAAAAGDRRKVTDLLAPAAWSGRPASLDGELNLRRWLVAQAYDSLKRPDSAAAYFGLLVEPVRTDWGDQLFRGDAVFARRRLALALDRAGRHEEARRHWQVFAETFTEPDPELRPLLVEARRKLAPDNVARR